ncbi:GTPase required for pre-60S ribosomal nuclear export [Salix suchowensis]|nr:GTPase required for pre-60S ribosomal nuclear export [Salix suchowensis]
MAWTFLRTPPQIRVSNIPHIRVQRGCSSSSRSGIRDCLPALRHARDSICACLLSYIEISAVQAYFEALAYEMVPVKKGTSASKTKSSTSSSSSVSLKRVKGENFYRNAKQVARLKMLNGGKPVRDKDGKIIQAAAFQKGEDETKPGRVQPDRRWFGAFRGLSPIAEELNDRLGNTRVISQTALDHFRTSLASKKDDPYSVLLRRNKLPMSSSTTLRIPTTRTHIVETEPFAETFGPKAQRKRPRVDAGTFEELSKIGAAAAEQAEEEATTSGLNPDPCRLLRTYIRQRDIEADIWRTVKVIDSSDVVLHVLDARDPMGTMCESVLEYLKKEKATSNPSWVTARYIQHLTPRYPTIGSLIQLLRQFAQLHSDKKQISVGLVGYPNVGKSSVINTIKSSKVWQYITLTRRIYLIDCPGIVPTSAQDDQTSTVLKGVVRVEALPTPLNISRPFSNASNPFIFLAHTASRSLIRPTHQNAGNPRSSWTA